MKTVYNRGDTVDIPMTNQTYNRVSHVWATADPDATYPRITITDAAGTARVSAAAMDKVVAGEYHYAYIVPADGPSGLWTVLIQVENGNYPNLKYLSFRVI